MRPLTIRFLNGPNRGRTLEFTRSPVRVGRSRENDVVLPEDHSPESSARHAEFRHDAGAWWIVDLGSTNGTRLNGSVVRRARLEAGDRVAFGEIAAVVGSRRAATVQLTLVVLALIATAVTAGFLAWRANQGPLDRIATVGSRSTYFIVLEDGERVLPVGTAFAIDTAGRLATNAHVASPLGEALKGLRRGIPFAVPQAAGSRRRIVGATVHPKWTSGSVENDVGWLQLDRGAPTSPAPLADATAIGALTEGTPVAIYGFPAAFTEASDPKASIAANVVREVRGVDYLIVGIAVAPGSSGSPVFAYDGRVVGLVAGSSRIAGEGSATAPAVALTTVPLLRLLGDR